MAIPAGVKIPSGQFTKFKDGKNTFRVLSEIVTGWEGWKDNKPFRHEGQICKIKPEQVDLNKNGKPNINYFWAMVVWNYDTQQIQTLQITQKTIMGTMFDLENNQLWGDLRNYDIEINKKKEGDTTKYSVLGIPPKAVSPEVVKAYEESDIHLEKLFDGRYPIENEEEADIDLDSI